MKLAEIADKISAHLQRIEADPKLNSPPHGGTMRPYFQAGAWAAGRYVQVRYISYQGSWSMPKSVAAAYLAWLDAGNTGKFDDKGKLYGRAVLAGK